MLRRKNYWLLFAILLLALTSLSPSMELDTTEGSYPLRQPQSLSEQPDSGDQGRVKSLSIRVSLSSEELKELERISSNYTLSSGIEVIISNVGNEENADMLKQELTTGESPDIIMTDGRNIADLATRGFLLPVDVYQSVPGSAPLTMLIPQMQWNGYDWGVPLDIDPYVLVYSPQRLAELGLAEAPKSLEQWGLLLNQLREQQEKTPGKEQYLLGLDSRNPYGYMTLLESMGFSLASDNTAALEWTQYARSYFYLSSRYNPDLWDMLQSGKLAIAALPLSEWQQYGNASLTAEAPMDMAGNKGYEAMHSRFFALPAGSSNPEAAVNWLAYITSSTAQLEWLENTKRLPALDELYQSSLPEITGLPFDSKLLLSEEAVTEEAPGRWNAFSAATTLLLTGKLDAAGYKAALSQKSE
ncbi:ABC transporter substrate-binding protein [Paenibacillus pedocola]|uniref:ABC transporter substrate-binding protein n=1 Tax=Paenibacillus pedocola TaxID=3242193 RepID=UPI002877C2D8|nr:extracellular solute-binding protein [Paenibacillus typhae]